VKVELEEMVHLPGCSGNVFNHRCDLTVSPGCPFSPVIGHQPAGNIGITLDSWWDDDACFFLKIFYTLGTEAGRFEDIQS